MQEVRKKLKTIQQRNNWRQQTLELLKLALWTPDKAGVDLDVDEEVKKLVLDDDVTKKTGIYPYVLTRKEKYLSIRAFTDAQKLAAYERQLGVCPVCNEHFELSQMEADHITPWHEGGRTIAENCQMLCKECNRRKSGK